MGGKRLNCSYLPFVPTTTPAALTITPPVPSEGSITARRLALARVEGMGSISMTCRDEGDMDNDEIDEVLRNFTHDLARTTTTTSAPAPGPAPGTTTLARAPP